MKNLRCSPISSNTFSKLSKKLLVSSSFTAAGDILIFEAALLDKLFLFMNPFTQISPGRLFKNIFSITLFLSKISLTINFSSIFPMG